MKKKWKEKEETEQTAECLSEEAAVNSEEETDGQNSDSGNDEEVKNDAPDCNHEESAASSEADSGVLEGKDADFANELKNRIYK